jgi:hypothetical protein
MIKSVNQESGTPLKASSNRASRVEALGWIGALLLVLAYAWKTLGSPLDILYHLMNLMGSAAIAYHSAKKATYPPAFLNLFWAMIAIVGILLCFFRA